MGEYGLGIDLGSRFTAAAITAGGAVEAVRLGGRRTEIPTAVFLRADGTVLTGEGARRRGESSPDRLAGDLLLRLTDPEPVKLGDTELSGTALMAQFLDQVIATATRGRAGRLARVVLTHPVGSASPDALRRAAQLAGLPEVTLHDEASAAAARARPGELVAVYDLGATFRATVLRRTDEGAEILATSRVDGVDFDRMVYEQVLSRFDISPDEAPADLARLRRECAEAVESLSFDTEAEIAVDLPGVHTRVTYRRSELEKLISPPLTETVAALRRTFQAASVRVDAADAVVLAGGSARIPLVGALVSAAIGRSVPPGEQPETAVAMGAARLSLPGADLAVSVAFPAVVLGAPFPAAVSPSPGTASAPVVPSLAAPVSPSPGTASTPVVPSVPAPVSPSPGTGSTPVAPSFLAAGPFLGGGFDETVAVRPPLDADPATRGVVRKRRGPIWTYRWPIAVGLAGLVVAAAVTVVALRPGDRSERSSPPGAPTTPPVALLWKTATGPGVSEPPAVSGDRVVLSSSDGTLRGYNRDDGKLAWSVAVGAGARVAAAIPGRRAYAVTTDGHLLAVDVGTGETVWRRTTGTTFDARPVVGEGRVYAGGRDGVLYAYALSGSHARWRVWADQRFRMSPTLVGSVAVAFAADGRLYGTDRDGTPIWKPTVGPATAAPVAAAGAACLPLEDGSVRCVRADNGAMLPLIRTDGITLKSVAGDGALVFAAGSDGSVGAWEPFSGGQRWAVLPAAGPARLLARAGEVDVAYPDGHLVGLDARTGAVRWRHRIPEPLSAAPAGDAGGLFVLGASGTLYALRPPGIAAGLGSSPSVAPPPTTRPPAGGAPPVHHSADPSISASSPSGPPSDPASSGPPASDPPKSDPPSPDADGT
jgi:outer membrane protein assembly factor BamB/actin-like ATPase involved in cell morphogenesis